MKAFSISFSSTIVPQNLPDYYRCLSLPFNTSTAIKSRIWPTAPRRFSSRSNRLPTTFSGVSTERGNLQWAAVPTSVPVLVAHELLQAGHHYLDVRTPDEFSAGHVVGAVNIPFMLRFGPGMWRNPDFLEEVLTRFGKDNEIIVGCQLGKRSTAAASELVSAGFTGITDMAGGYAAWTKSGLPVE